MNWEAIGAGAELLGSGAVIVTLVFVVVQLRHSSSTVRNSTVQNASNAYIDILTQLISDPELYGIYHRGIRSFEKLTEEEYGRFEILMLVMFRMLESQYRQYKNGGADEEMWASLVKTFQAMLRMPGVYASWQRQKAILSTGFVRHVDSLKVTPNEGT
jgi:hypothetical protein